jgi:hypothetical protein
MLSSRPLPCPPALPARSDGCETRRQARLIPSWKANEPDTVLHDVAGHETSITQRHVRSLDQLGLANAGLPLFRIDDVQRRAGSPHAHLYFLPDVVDLPSQHIDADR